MLFGNLLLKVIDNFLINLLDFHSQKEHIQETYQAEINDEIPDIDEFITKLRIVKQIDLKETQ